MERAAEGSNAFFLPIKQKGSLFLSLSHLSRKFPPLDINITYMLFAWLGLDENGARNEDFFIHFPDLFSKA